MKKIDSINIIPFIDIMLVLFTIVLMSATFIQNGKIDINLPKGATTTETKALEKRTITIQEGGSIYLDDKLVDLKDLEGSLLGLDRETIVAIKADKMSPFDHFAQVISILKTSGLQNISIITERGEQ